ncbi:hypothetical protein PSEUBRA_004726 [Kalmanozyma brasiliensis GHG001]|uniref:Uncharacterized protein n=1 Tax=Kalmanozyma brasiliensis (strain GHG001) TaxID=1365824 RepID=V5EUD6_KALBG|nr:uncharacterized protein PSEUBRA_004726 [Kalmanozyma brasiliensis GHG001]EST05714.1 hypothetical protein PSEUBRA_004726 [Kalmanozyma brasiliensis GHG001]
MLARSSRSLIGSTWSAAGVARPSARLALPSIVSQLPLRRTFASSPTTRNSAAESEKSSNDHADAKEVSKFNRLEYILREQVEPTHESMITQLEDDHLSHLPLVVSSGSKWAPLPAGFSLPRRDRAYKHNDPLSARIGAEYVYNTFNFPTTQHLKRFNAELASTLTHKARNVQPVTFSNPASRTFTMGLPSFVGLEPPYPVNKNVSLVLKLLNEYRLRGTSAEHKQRIAEELRKYVVPHGFKRTVHIFSLYVLELFEALRNASEQEAADKVSFGLIGDGEQAMPARKATNPVKGFGALPGPGQEGSKGKRERTPRRKSEGERKPNLADRLRADDPRLPEAGTFVAQDGGAIQSNDGVDGLQEHVPFPTPSAEEMGIKKPTDTGTGSLSADDPKLPEAGTFVAQDGEAHKPSKGVDDLQEHVPFPTPSAHEMGMNKPTDDLWSAGSPTTPQAPESAPPQQASESVHVPQEHSRPAAADNDVNSADLWSADNPKLPEAGTFVAQDGDAHKPSEGVDSLEEHVPFPKPTAEEMGIKKPTE